MRRFAWTLAITAALALPGCASWQGLKLLVAGDNIKLRESSGVAAADRPTLLLLAMDGVDRDLLYDMLHAGELPQLARLLGGSQGGFAHAYFEQDLLSTLPSSTGVAWATAMTGRPASEHGVAGNEYFIRASRTFAAPVPVTVSQIEPVLKIYTEGYANSLLESPTVYQRMRETDPGVSIWVAMHQFYAGADRLILADRSALVEAMQVFFQDTLAAQLNDDQSLGVFREIDEETFENITEALNDDPAPDVLTIYLPGVDHFAHIAEAGPDAARRRYLKEALEPLFAELYEALAEAQALDERYVVITSDHGHTRVIHDDAHALSTSGDGEPPTLLERSGFTLRPFAQEVAEDHPFDTVLAYQGAMAYAYVADRSTCPIKGQVCDWSRPARQADITALAEAFHRNNRDGLKVPELKGVLDMILVRKPGAQTGVFEVYLGNGRSQPVAEYLKAHPHPEYVALARRLADLTEGPHGQRAGDVILIANNGNRSRPEQRYYFASLYHSWHGSPSAQDARVPLIVAHPGRDRAALAGLVGGVLAEDNSLAAVGRLLYALRYAGQ